MNERSTTVNSRSLVRATAGSLLRLLPGRLQGRVDYWRRESISLGSPPLNGQAVRKHIFERIFREFEVRRLVETGTARGQTTEFLASFGLPVMSVEMDSRFFAFCLRRFRGWSNVQLHCGDSTKFLRRQVVDGAFEQGLTVFYLDAHADGVLPLRDEVSIICNAVKEHLIIVDDFEVPGDTGYKFADYGPGLRPCVAYLETISAVTSLAVFFPSAPSSEETGSRCGTAFITATPSVRDRLSTFEELVYFGDLGGEE